LHKPTIPKSLKAIQFVLFFIFLLCGEFLHAGEYSGKVIKVTDGDFINIIYEGKPLRIRLAEIDAPERGQPFWKNPEKL